VYESPFEGIFLIRYYGGAIYVRGLEPQDMGAIVAPHEDERIGGGKPDRGLGELNSVTERAMDGAGRLRHPNSP